MNLSKLKTYAPHARKDFIAAVTDRAAFYGLTAKSIEPVVEQGDVAFIGERPSPRYVTTKRKLLEDQIRRDGFGQTMEAIAYTWFNRFAAIRYMELHGYLDHGYRVLSHPEGLEQPEILDHAVDLDLPGLDHDKVVELKLDGNKDEELYRLLLSAQCNALHDAMPFLFERIGDETELLLPANLLHTDSLIRRLVAGIDESDWGQIEIIGWLYQFYISDKKDEVIGKVVKSEDIPAATQLFTPNWIVKYMVQNSLGAQWLATYPASKLKGQMDYYIEPAEQTDEVNAQLKAITPSVLNPEELTLIDPACGSGHILVEAYELFKTIYMERGYRQRDVPKLIIEKNLFGLDIDKRAAQLSGFALMMTGRADDRRLFERDVKLNVMALVDSTDFDVERLIQGVKLGDYGLRAGDLTDLKRLFEHATTFGSLIQVPKGLPAKLSALKQLSEVGTQDLFVSDALKRLILLVRQTKVLAAQYDTVVANPPYMGGRYMNPLVKRFAVERFPYAKSDLFACFIERGYTLAKDDGHSAMVTMQSWMFLSSFESMRERMLREKTITTMAHLGPGGFAHASAMIVQTTVFVLRNRKPHAFIPVFFQQLDGGEEQKRESLLNGEQRFTSAAQEDFKKIPGCPVAYWISRDFFDTFRGARVFNDVATPKQGLATGDNTQFLRSWFEVDFETIAFGCSSNRETIETSRCWVPYSKGGGFRRWSGLHSHVVFWANGGEEIRNFKDENGNERSRFRAASYYFKPSVTWGLISDNFSVRYRESGYVFDIGGMSAFSDDLHYCLGLLNSTYARKALGVINPTLNFQIGDVKRIPIPNLKSYHAVKTLVTTLVQLADHDWNAYERSWDFRSLPILAVSSGSSPTLESSYTDWIAQNCETIAEMKRLEEENNRFFINAYGLKNELTPDVPIEQITLTVNPAYRCGGSLTEEEQWTRFRQETMEEIVSYAIGCMMGRYSLDEPGLIYANSGNEGFDSSRYSTFPADDDGIVPLTDAEWFDDDAYHRLEEFISVVWDAVHIEDNLTFLADNLSPNKNESSRDTIRRYLCDNFFKDHLKTYKKRPIYWLFSSGKQKAFQCLVYLHRYNEGTLARMRTEYVIPLQGMVASRISQLEGDITAATTNAHRKRLEKERGKLVKQRTELQEFDEKLRHFADQRISLDLDEGVKVNYGKFGDLLAEVKAITGVKPN